MIRCGAGRGQGCTAQLGRGSSGASRPAGCTWGARMHGAPAKGGRASPARFGGGPLPAATTLRTFARALQQQQQQRAARGGHGGRRAASAAGSPSRLPPMAGVLPPAGETGGTGGGGQGRRNRASRGRAQACAPTGDTSGQRHTAQLMPAQRTVEAPARLLQRHAQQAAQECLAAHVLPVSLLRRAGEGMSAGWAGWGAASWASSQAAANAPHTAPQTQESRRPALWLTAWMGHSTTYAASQQHNNTTKKRNRKRALTAGMGQAAM